MIACDTRQIIEGLILDEHGTLLVDLTRSRSFRLKGLTATGQWKDYLLRVNDSGKLSLV